MTRGMLALAAAIHEAGLTWTEAADKMRCTGGHVGRVLKGEKPCGAATRESAGEAFGVHAPLWREIANPKERREWERLVAEMKAKQRHGKTS